MASRVLSKQGAAFAQTEKARGGSTEMPGWFAREIPMRFAELSADLAHLSSASLEPAAIGPRLCELLRQALQAEAVLLFQMSADKQHLALLAGSPNEGLIDAALPLESLPDWQGAMAGGEAHWLEASQMPVEVAVLAGRRSLCFPLQLESEPLGCLLAVFAAETEPPTAEETELGEAVAFRLALVLDRAKARKELDLIRLRVESFRRVSSQQLRLGLDNLSLDALLAGGLEASGCEAAALYESAPPAWVRSAVAGPAPLLPAVLPAGASAELPWDRARQEGRSLLAEAGLPPQVLEPWLPQPEARHFRLGVVPLPETGNAPAFLLYCLGPGKCEKMAEAVWSHLALLTLAHRAAQRARREAEERASQSGLLFEQLEAGSFFFDATGLLHRVSPSLLRLTGYLREEMEGRPLGDFLPTEDWEGCEHWLRAPGAPIYSATVEWRVKSGGSLVVRLALHDPGEGLGPSHDSLLVGFVRDARVEHEAEERADLAAVRFQGLLDSVNDGVWLLDSDNRIVAANHRLAQLFGVHFQELSAKLPQSQALERLKLHFADAPEALARWRDLAARPGEVAWDELELLRPRLRVLQRYARPLLEADGAPVGRLEIYHDITEQRRLEDKVLQREKLATLGQLLTGIAHEINNPLTAVSGYAELLLAESLTPALREKTARLRLEAERASRIVRSLLVFARGETAERQPLHLAEILTRTLALRAYEFKIENIRVTREFSPDVPRVFADATQLQQVFLNLLLNAEQAIRSQRQHGQVTLRVRWEPTRERVLAEVADDGPGIPPAALPHIFDPFFTTKTTPEGTGLGLSISRAIVRGHGGELSVTSGPGDGATFTVELPAHPVPTRVEPPEPRPAGRVARPVRKEGQRILVVDDEPVVAHLIADALRQHGHAVQVHTDSRRALATACREPFQLIICDIRMPELDGPGFHRLLAQRQPGLARRVLFTTGDTLARETLEFLEHARLPYLPKPFHVEELRSVVNNLLYELEQLPPGGDGRSRPH